MSLITVTIEPRRAADESISKLVLGNFIELGFGRQAPLMWAEMLNNRTFRTVPPPATRWLQLDPGLFDRSVPFWHSGYEEMDWQPLAGEGMSLARAHGTDSFKGNDCLAIHNRAGGRSAGIRQQGIHLGAGVYQLSVFGSFAGSKVTVPPEFADPAKDPSPETRQVHLTVRSESAPGRILAERSFSFLSTQQRYDWSFAVADFSGRAALQISFSWEGALLLSWCSLVPADNVEGWRRDVVELLRRVGPPVIRFPGGCFASFYDWRDGVGPRDRRPVRTSYYWGGLEENDVGIDEFLRLAELVGFEPQVCVNMMTGSPEAAADLVEYCNGSDDTRMGRLRGQYGVARRSRVRFWEMENEAGRKWSALQYAAEVREYALRMREVDPGITIMMEFYSWDKDWLPRMLDVAGRHIDAVINRLADRAFVAWALPILRDFNRRNGTRIRLANTEWLPDFDPPGALEDPGVPRRFTWESADGKDYRKTLQLRQVSWFYALNAASRIVDYLSYGGEFFLANFNNCVNTWGQNIIESSKEGAWLSPCGRVFEFFRDDDSSYPLETRMDRDEGGEITVQACETARGSINLYAVNRGLESRRLRLATPAGFSARSARILRASERLSTNALGTDAVEHRQIKLDGATVILEPLSVLHVPLER